MVIPCEYCLQIATMLKSTNMMLGIVHCTIITLQPSPQIWRNLHHHPVLHSPLSCLPQSKLELGPILVGGRRGKSRLVRQVIGLPRRKDGWIHQFLRPQWLPAQVLKYELDSPLWKEEQHRHVDIYSPAVEGAPRQTRWYHICKYLMVGKRICFGVVRKSYQFVDDDHCIV